LRIRVIHASGNLFVEKIISIGPVREIDGWRIYPRPSPPINAAV